MTEGDRSKKVASRWCKRCSRYHKLRTVCDLYLRERTAKSGRIVKRWCH